MDFTIYCPISVMKATREGDPSRRLRIGGVVSTDRLDKQHEEILQEGLDFSDCIREGWFNDNHSGSSVTGPVGVPGGVTFFRKGQTLPDGTVARRPCWWVEGYLLDDDQGQALYAKLQAVEKTGGDRRYGFSIEGSVVERDPFQPHRVKKAKVRNIAITHCPVNVDSYLVTLAKALTSGGAGAPGDGGALQPESLEKGPSPAAPPRLSEVAYAERWAEACAAERAADRDLLKAVRLTPGEVDIVIKAELGRQVDPRRVLGGRA